MGPSSRTVQSKDAIPPLLTAFFVAAALALATLSPARGEEPVVAKCAAGAAGDPNAPTPGTVQVAGDKVRNSKGLITAVLYSDDPKTFLKSGKKLDRIRVEAHEGETVLCLKAPANGRYSVALYHDENGNKKFDRDFLGIPVEGYGFSQNPGFRFGKPELEETLFTINSALTSLRISILYL
ncbi:DUF2141 domain-containing protein [Pelagibius marinus]|uniref:DUF2141 domain-containing protein n=1 Tax=Pelagibius marinus TaxID=2762760 RepID=UPI0018725988|nr:DUF2141 domain-containing protein [Pelagibius marinus]